MGRVQLVDDDASFRTAMERLLKHAGYEVATYASANPWRNLCLLPSGSAFLTRLQDRHPRYRQPAGAAVRRSQSAAALRCIGLLFTTAHLP